MTASAVHFVEKALHALKANQTREITGLGDLGKARDGQVAVERSQLSILGDATSLVHFISRQYSSSANAIMIIL